MAFPNQQFVELINESTVTTLRNMSKDVADNLSRNNALYAMLKRKGAIEEFDGGTVLQEAIMFPDGQAPIRYFGPELYPINNVKNITAAIYDYKQYVRPITMDGREDFSNSGEARWIDLWTTKLQAAIGMLTNQVNYDLYSDGSLPNQIGGLQLIVADNPATSTLGGLSGTLYPIWRNQSRAVTVPITTANIQSYMGQMFNSLTRNNDMPDLIIADNIMYELFLESLTINQRFTNNAGMADLGFNAVEFRGVPVVMDGGFQGLAPDDGVPVGGAPTGHMYFLNTRYLKLKVAKGRNFDAGPVKWSQGQDSISMDIFWWGQLVCSARFLQGVVYQSA